MFLKAEKTSFDFEIFQIKILINYQGFSTTYPSKL